MRRERKTEERGSIVLTSPAVTKNVAGGLEPAVSSREIGGFLEDLLYSLQLTPGERHLCFPRGRAFLWNWHYPIPEHNRPVHRTHQYQKNKTFRNEALKCNAR